MFVVYFLQVFWGGVFGVVSQNMWSPEKQNPQITDPRNGVGANTHVLNNIAIQVDINLL